MKNKWYLVLVVMFLVLLLVNIYAFAHKVNIFYYVEGDTLYTESYFNDGKKSMDSKIEVYDNLGNKITEGLTNQEGIFSFKVPSEKGDLKIILTASMGHQAECIIRADELKDTAELAKENLEKPIPSKETAESVLVYMTGEVNKVVSPEIISQNLKEVRLLIENILDEKLAPIMQEIKKSQEEKISFAEIIGGIGYIFGFIGIIAYFLNRKKIT